MEMDVWILTSISGSHPGFLRALSCLGSSSKRRSRIRQHALSRLRGSDSLQLRGLLVEKVLVVLYRSMDPSLSRNRRGSLVQKYASPSADKVGSESDENCLP